MPVSSNASLIDAQLASNASISNVSMQSADSPATDPFNADLSHQRPNKPRPSRLKLTYDIVMLIAISVDLLLISIDAILMSNFSNEVTRWLALGDALSWYQDTLHIPLRTAGGFFTIFLILELSLRWAIAIKDQIYYRWFFFPFIHWYEVLGCFPQLRALRLFRAVVIGRRLHQLGYQVLPQPWINRIKFYINILLEELSDRVILTTIHNYKEQLTDSAMQKSLIQKLVDRNRDDMEAVLLSLLQTELAPQLQKLSGKSAGGALIANEVGLAIEDGIANTPELHRLLRLIPIAGSLIESQLQQIGHSVGENVVYSLNERLLQPELIDALLKTVAHSIAHMDINNTELDTLVASIIADSLTEFEAQIKVQQWKHHDMLRF